MSDPKIIKLRCIAWGDEPATEKTFVCPYWDLLPPLPPAEREALKASIQEHRMKTPIIGVNTGEENEVLLLDGFHRLSIAEELGLAADDVPQEIIGDKDDYEQEQLDALAEELNLKRRHLSQEQRAEWALKLRQQGKSYREIGDKLGVGKSTVYDDLATVRFRTVELPDTITGADGRERPAKMPPREPKEEAQPELFPAPKQPTPKAPFIKCHCGLLAWDGQHCMKHAAELKQASLSISTPEESSARVMAVFDQAEQRKTEAPAQSAPTCQLHEKIGELERRYMADDWGCQIEIPGKKKRYSITEALTLLPFASVIHEVSQENETIGAHVFRDAEMNQYLCSLIAAPPALPALAKPTYRETVDTNREAKHAAIAGEAKSLASPDKLGPFSVIYCDPPWQYSAQISEAKSIERQYPTLSIDELCKLPISMIAALRSVLYLWVTAPLIKEALQLIEAWGFSYKTHYIWVKGTNGAGMGHWARIDHELLFVATRGNFPTPAPENRISSILEYARGRHSEKPREVRDYLDKLYGEHPRVELFARETAEGWVSLGNEIDGRDIRDVIVADARQMGLPRAATPQEEPSKPITESSPPPELSASVATSIDEKPEASPTQRGRCHFCELLNDCTLLGGKKLICAECRTKELRGRCSKCWAVKNDNRVIDDELQCASCQEVFSLKTKKEELSAWPHWFCLFCGFYCIEVAEWNAHHKEAHSHHRGSASPITINGRSCCVTAGEVTSGALLRKWLCFGASAVAYRTEKDPRWKGLQDSVDLKVGNGWQFRIDQYGADYIGPKPTSKEAAAPDAVGPRANRALSQLKACTTREEFDQTYTKLEALASTLDERNELLAHREELRAKLPSQHNVKQAFLQSAEKNPEKVAELPPAPLIELIHMQAWLVEHANLDRKGGYTLFEDEARDVSLTPKQFKAWQNDARIKMRTPDWLEEMTADMKRANTVGEGTRVFDAMIDLTVTTAERDQVRAIFSEWKRSKPATVPYNAKPKAAPKPARKKGKNEEVKPTKKKAGRR